MVFMQSGSPTVISELIVQRDIELWINNQSRLGNRVLNLTSLSKFSLLFISCYKRVFRDLSFLSRRIQGFTWILWLDQTNLDII